VSSPNGRRTRRPAADVRRRVGRTGARRPASEDKDAGAAGRREILAAATREFADHGYAGATTAGIARRAGVTQPLVHHHFGSKRGLWSAVLELLFKDLESEFARTLDGVGAAPRPERLKALLRALVRFSGRRPELSRLIRIESSGGGEAFDELYERWLERWLRFFSHEVDAASADGSVRPVDPRLAYFVIVGAATAPFAEPEAARRAFGLDVSHPPTIDRYAEMAIELLLHGLLPRGLPLA
jgi:AcrR family transcriptional regulator